MKPGNQAVSGRITAFRKRYASKGSRQSCR